MKHESGIMNHELGIKSRVRNSLFLIHNSRIPKGFTLIEVLLVIGVMALVVGIGFMSLSGARQTAVLDGTARHMVAVLRNAQARAIAEQAKANWGVRFAGVAAGDDYYALWSGEEFVTATSTVYLSPILEFSDPVAGAVKDVRFTKLTGIPAASASVTVRLARNPGVNRTIVISSQGAISF